MFIWPHSATLAEDGGTAPGSAPAGGFGGMGGGAGAAMNAGEILLNRAESAALAALETEENEDHAIRRASAESGLNRQQITKLKQRATTAVAKGYTLKGQGFTKKPQAQSPDEPGLTRKAVKGEEPAPTRKVQAPLPKKTTEAGTLASVTRKDSADDALYTCPEMDSYGFPAPQSAGQAETLQGTPAAETNTMTTLASMLRRNRKRRMV